MTARDGPARANVGSRQTSGVEATCCVSGAPGAPSRLTRSTDNGDLDRGALCEQRPLDVLAAQQAFLNVREVGGVPRRGRPINTGARATWIGGRRLLHASLGRLESLEIRRRLTPRRQSDLLGFAHRPLDLGHVLAEEVVAVRPLLTVQPHSVGVRATHRAATQGLPDSFRGGVAVHSLSAGRGLDLLAGCAGHRGDWLGGVAPCPRLCQNALDRP